MNVEMKIQFKFKIVKKAAIASLICPDLLDLNSSRAIFGFKSLGFNFFRL